MIHESRLELLSTHEMGSSSRHDLRRWSARRSVRLRPRRRRERQRGRRVEVGVEAAPWRVLGRPGHGRAEVVVQVARSGARTACTLRSAPRHALRPLRRAGLDLVQSCGSSWRASSCVVVHSAWCLLHAAAKLRAACARRGARRTVSPRGLQSGSASVRLRRRGGSADAFWLAASGPLSPRPALSLSLSLTPGRAS